MLIGTTHFMGNLEQNHPTGSLQDTVAHETILVLKATTTSEKNYLLWENICSVTQPIDSGQEIVQHKVKSVLKM